jgi:hypothetical protein
MEPNQHARNERCLQPPVRKSPPLNVRDGQRSGLRKRPRILRIERRHAIRACLFCAFSSFVAERFLVLLIWLALRRRGLTTPALDASCSNLAPGLAAARQAWSVRPYFSAWVTPTMVGNSCSSSCCMDRCLDCSPAGVRTCARRCWPTDSKTSWEVPWLSSHEPERWSAPEIGDRVGLQLLLLVIGQSGKLFQPSSQPNAILRFPVNWLASEGLSLGKT